jgi:ATP-dependent Zn protease
MPTSPRKTAVAYHEAGHAVIGRVLGLSGEGATIVPNSYERTLGVARVSASGAIEKWEKRGKFRSLDSVYVADVMTKMAGAETEAVLLGRVAVGDSDDRLQIGMIMEEMRVPADGDWDRYEARLRSMTRCLVRRHGARIERVAKALLAKHTLSAAQIDRLMLHP